MKEREDRIGVRKPPKGSDLIIEFLADGPKTTMELRRMLVKEYEKRGEPFFKNQLYRALKYLRRKGRIDVVGNAVFLKDPTDKLRHLSAFHIGRDLVLFSTTKLPKLPDPGLLFPAWLEDREMNNFSNFLKLKTPEERVVYLSQYLRMELAELVKDGKTHIIRNPGEIKTPPRKEVLALVSTGDLAAYEYLKAWLLNFSRSLEGKRFPYTGDTFVEESYEPFEELVEEVAQAKKEGLSTAEAAKKVIEDLYRKTEGSPPELDPIDYLDALFYVYRQINQRLSKKTKTRVRGWLKEYFEEPDDEDRVDDLRDEVE